MTPFEEQITKALTRREAPPNLEAKILAAIAELPPTRGKQPREKWLGKVFPVSRVWLWRCAPALAALVIVASSALYQQRIQTQRGEAAKQQLLAAMRIAGAKLHSAQQQVFAAENSQIPLEKD